MFVCTVLCIKTVAQCNFICIFHLCLVRKTWQYPIGCCLISNNIFVLSSMSASTKYNLQRSPGHRKSLYRTWSWILQAYSMSQCVSTLLFFVIICFHNEVFLKYYDVLIEGKRSKVELYTRWRVLNPLINTVSSIRIQHAWLQVNLSQPWTHLFSYVCIFALP